MSRPARYRHSLSCAKEEALLACDLYNERRRARNLEAFLVHMGMAWNNLLQAIFIKDRVNVFFKNARGRFERTPEGDRKTLSTREMLRRVFPDDQHPVRKNVEFFVGLRDKVEHRLTAEQQRNLRDIVGGKSQAYLRNFEKTLVEHFPGESVADQLHLPLFLSVLDEEAIKAIKSVRATLPKDVVTYIESFEAHVADVTIQSEHYDFRIFLVPHLGKKGDADLAVEFIDLSKMTAEEASGVSKAMVIARDRHVEVANLERMKASEVVQKVKLSCPSFTMNFHTEAWRFFKVRPRSNATDKTRTEAKYCVYDRAHNDYLYTDAWVKKLKMALATDPEAVRRSWRDVGDLVAVEARAL